MIIVHLEDFVRDHILIRKGYWIYVVADDEQVIYVGWARNPRTRITMHKMEHSPLGNAIKIYPIESQRWRLYILSVQECRMLQTQQQAKKYPIHDIHSAEHFMIKLTGPILNIAGNKYRRSWARGLDVFSLNYPHKIQEADRLGLFDAVDIVDCMWSGRQSVRVTETVADITIGEP